MTDPRPAGAITLITGAATGIGAASALLLARPGARLLLHTGRNAAALAEVAARAREQGAEVVEALGDLAQAQTAPALVANALESFGGLDSLVSNAGRAQQGRLATLDDDSLTAAFATMPLAFLRLCRAAMPALIAAGRGGCCPDGQNAPAAPATGPETPCGQGRGARGRVVAISSFVAHGYGTNGLHFPATAAAKAALESLVRSLAVELAADGVTVNAIAPGFTRKDATGHAATSRATMDGARAITPNGRLGLPEDIAQTLAWLVSPGARHVTGQVIHVDGGLLLP